MQLQGTSKERFPGCVKLDEKVAFCLPTAGRRRNLFHPNFPKPGKHSLEVPCTYFSEMIVPGVEIKRDPEIGKTAMQPEPAQTADLFISGSRLISSLCK